MITFNGTNTNSETCSKAYIILQINTFLWYFNFGGVFFG